jgi:hypothetical protein
VSLSDLGGERMIQTLQGNIHRDLVADIPADRSSSRSGPCVDIGLLRARAQTV